MRVLMVCTANLSRSPVAERSLARHLGSRLGDGPATVRSAGVRARVGFAADPVTAAAAERIGLSLADHAARQVDAAMIDDDGADLVVVMTRAHWRDVAVLQPSCRERLVTLRELARAIGDGAPDMAAVVAAMQRVGPFESGAHVDVSDPVGRPLAEHEAVCREVDEMCAAVAAWLPGRLGA